ncbi:MAG: TolC family protein [Thermoanaerobaculia bacterium]
MRLRPAALAALSLLGLAAAGCVESRPKAYVDASTPTSPEKRMAAPMPAAPPAAATVTLPPGTLPETGGLKTISPAQAVDLALRNNPATRQSWFQARAAAANVGSKRAAYYPYVELDGTYLRQKSAVFNGQTVYFQTNYGPNAILNWLLFDFGGRAATVAEAEAFLAQANAAHDAILNDVILQVLQAYYGYEGAKSLLSAQEASLKQAEENLRAAEERHRAGVATIADVLQARTTASQQRLAYDTVKGQIAVIRGALATALGVPANMPVEAGELPENLNLDRVTRTVDDLIAQAEKERPDLAAARSAAHAAERHVASVRSSLWPTLGGTAAGGWTYFGGSAAGSSSDVYSVGLLLRIPVFTGFQTQYDLRQAQETEKAAVAAAESVEQLVIQQVWSSYYNVQTAAQKIRTARDLLASAGESADVTRGRYTAGVGSILDLLTAESALASARAQDVGARAEFLFALAQLAHDVGSIEPVVKEAP